jgi:hypothetical protein
MVDWRMSKLSVNGDLNVALVRAADNGHVDVVDCLVRHAMFDPSADDNIAIEIAAYEGRLAVVERMLQDERIDPSADDNCAVQNAAQNGHFAVVDRLLQDVRVDPSANDNYAVRMAAEYGHFAVVDRLLEDDRVDVAVAIQCSLPEHLKRFECRERLIEICIALQAMELPAWITVQILVRGRHCRSTASGAWCARSSTFTINATPSSSEIEQEELLNQFGNDPTTLRSQVALMTVERWVDATCDGDSRARRRS